MKKIIGLSVIGMTLFLASCGKNEQANSSETSQSTVQTSETTATTVSETATNDSNTETVVKETNSTATTIAASSTAQSINTSATTVPDSTINSTSEMPSFTPEQKQALDAIYAKYPNYKDPDIAFIFWQMIDEDYLFKAYSLSTTEHGGSGTLTFFRVSPTGDVQETDPSGNPY